MADQPAQPNSAPSPGEVPTFKQLIFNRAAWRNSPKNLLGDSAIPRGALIKASLADLKAVYAKKQYRKETFQAAVLRKRLTESDLSKTLGSLIVSSRMAYAFAVIGLLATGYQSVYGTPFSSLAGAVVVLFCILNGWIRAYRAWQIVNRRFGSLQEFLSASDSWIV